MRRYDVIRFVGSAVLLFVLIVQARGADRPHLVAAWPAGPFETHVAFDRAVDPAILAKLVGTRIVFGDDVKAGDRYAAHKVGDPVPAIARGSLRIVAARLDDEGRTLILATDPHSRDSHYVLNLPLPVGLDVVYNLQGVESSWDDGKQQVLRWWPSVNFDEVGKRLAGSAGWSALQSDFKTRGQLTLKTMLTLPKGKATIVVKSSVPFEVLLGNESAKSNAEHLAEISAEVESNLVDLSITLTLDGKTPFTLTATDIKGQSLKFILPWAPTMPPLLAPAAVPSELLSGGDPVKGGLIFKGDKGKCSICHKFRGEGGEVGPDLSDLSQRDRAWIYRNIAEPSAVIHPDYVSYTVLTKAGQVLAGIVRAEGADAIKVVDTAAKATVIKKIDIEELKPVAASIMPVGLVGAIGEADIKNLLAYLSGK